MAMRAAVMKGRLSAGLKYLVLSLWAVVTIFPLYWTFVNSFRTNNQIFSRAAWLPESFSNLDNYRAMLQNNLPRSFFNTFTITALTMVLLLFCAVCASFLLSVYRFRYARPLHSLLIMGIVIPRLSVLIASYMNFNAMGLLGHKYALVFCYTAFELPLAVYLLVGFMRSLPPEIFESAIIDGCSSPQLLRNIVLPMSRNGIVTVLIISTVSVWNDYIYARIFLTNKKHMTITILIASAKTEFMTDYGMQMAGVILTVAPIILVYFFLQDKIINGMVMGAVKG